jgi:hypothetical protein
MPRLLVWACLVAAVLLAGCASHRDPHNPFLAPHGTAPLAPP